MQGQRAVPHSRSSLAQGAGAINAVLKKAAARGAHCIHAYTGAWQVAFVHMGHPGRAGRTPGRTARGMIATARCGART
jgi:hypothetical protein